jgi:hypothetical protein
MMGAVKGKGGGEGRDHPPMHEFEFEVRISAQIQTVKMAVGRHLKFYSNIVSFSFAKN